MKLGFLIGSLLILTLVPCLNGQTLEHVSEMQESLKKLDIELSSSRPWENGGLTAVQRGQLNAAQKVVNEASGDQGFLITICSLLDQYKEDTYPRQILFQAIMDKKDYSDENLKVLTQIFVKTLSLKHERLPRGFELIWIEPAKARIEIAHKIIDVTGAVKAMNDPDENLLHTEPSAWIKKYGRN